MKTIEELLEDDILRFFDEELGVDQKKKKIVRAEEETMYDVQRDFEKEVKAALEKDDLHNAKKIFDELRINYAKLKYSDIEKPKMFRILDNIHLQIKNYLIAKKKEQNIYDEMKSMDSEPSPEAIDKLDASAAPSSNAKEEFVLEEPYSKVERLMKENNLEAARDAAKELIGKYNDLDPVKRTNEVYEHIKQLLVKLQ